MRASRLLWQLFASYLGITLASLLAVGWLATHALQRFYLHSVQQDLTINAEVLESQIGDQFEKGDTSKMAAICQAFSRTTGARVTVIRPDGTVLVDSDQDAAELENHGDRPEVRAALAGGIGGDERYSDSLRERMLYRAIPIRRAGQIVGVLRMALPDAAIDRSLRGAQGALFTQGLAIAAVAVLASLWFARRLSRPLEEIRLGAERLARGDLGHALPTPHTEELASLVESLNRMAHQIKDRIRATMRQNTEQEAVLASMVEGVLAVDNDERVISLNQAAADLLGTNQAEAQGRGLQEVIRNAELRRFVASALACESPVEGDVVLGSGPDRMLQAHGTALRDAHGQAIGAVIVLNDITRLRRLENLRRDFVANVSHELKTPITSIKGFVETLLDGALHDPDNAERFLRIMAKQADRLNSIIEDLLSLSKIEQGEEAGDIVLTRGGVRHVLEEAIDDIQSRAAERDIHIELTCDPALEAPLNPHLLEQAVINLLDNAVKYSEPGHDVQLIATAYDQEVSIAVIDRGCGVSAEHLPRLFERFYRVDRARSRKLGGTGLGLAIVKHIVQAHRGQIDVESTPGKGSTFTIRLPRSISERGAA
jgi:two-component system phosphate regulon sensor histidine kinase PhoR